MIDRIRTKDIFGFFSLNKKITLTKEITFLPKIYETMVDVSEGVRHFAGETEEDEPEAAAMTIHRFIRSVLIAPEIVFRQSIGN